MLDIVYEIELLYEKAKVLLKPEILTIIILIGTLLSDRIINLILIILGKVLKISKKEILTFPSKNLKNYAFLTGIYFILNVWITEKTILKNINSIYRVISILVLARTVVNVINPKEVIIKKINEQKKSKINVEILNNEFIYNVITVVIYIIAIFIIITDMGYNINGLVAGLGIGSAIIALAVQDLVKSIISGATIISEKPFVIGETIQIGTDRGVVETVTLRNTVIRLKDNSVMNIPNSMITANAVINFNKIERRRIETRLYFNFNTDTKKIKRVLYKIENMMKNQYKVIEETVIVKFEDILQDGLMILIDCYIDESEHKKYLETREKLNIKIMEILKTENINPLYKMNGNQILKENEIKNEEKKHIKE